MEPEGNILVLDSLFDDVAVERATAAALGWTVSQWNGSGSQLQAARVVLHVTTRVDRSLLDRMPSCRVVARFGSGLDTVDQEATAERGIVAVGVRDYCVPELVTHTLGLAFALDRRLDATRRGGLASDSTWQQVAERLHLPGRTTAAVIGAGSIGLAVGSALVAIGLSVCMVTKRDAADVHATGAEVGDLDDAIASAGFVFLHTSLTPETERLLDEARLDRMRPDAILVNTARLGLMDEAAVADALTAERLGGLGLDARLGRDSPLRPFLDDDRVLHTPHVGWYSERSAHQLRTRAVRAAIAAAPAGHGTSTTRAR